MAAQAVSNAVASVVFALALHIRLVSHIPTALRAGVGCGISILVSVLGMRSMGLLVANEFAFQPLSWQTVSSSKDDSGVMTALLSSVPHEAAEAWYFGLLVGSCMLSLRHCLQHSEWEIFRSRFSYVLDTR